MSSDSSKRECESCGEVHENPFHWKRLPRPTTLDLPTDLKERATVLFHLIDPVDSAEWSDYLKAREEAEWEFADLMCPNDDEGDRYAQQVPECVWDSLSKAIPDDEDLAGRIADAVVVRSCDTRDAGDPTVEDADAHTRVFSLCSPAWVDFHIQYSERTGWDFVDCVYALGYRISNKPLSKKTSTSVYSSGVQDMHTANGWRPIGWYELDEKRRDVSRCNISRGDILAVHEVLFGLNTDLSRRVPLKATAELMITVCGVPFSIAEKEGDADGIPDFESLINIGNPGSGSKPGISAAHMRKILNMPALKDDDPADLSTVQIGEAPFGDEEEDDDELTSDGSDEDMDGGYSW